MEAQEGLFHAPGAFCAVSLWRLESTLGWPYLRKAVSTFMAEVRRHGEVHAVVGLDAKLVDGAEPGHPLLPREKDGARFPSTQAHVLLQLSAPEREPLLFALRRLPALFAGLLLPEEEVLGGKIGDGREPFGFRDGLRSPSHEDIRRTALLDEGPLAGGSWLLYLRFQQQLARFGRLRPHEQDRVVGQGREGEPLHHAPEDGHVVRMRWAGAGENAGFIRRGFPFRAEREEGLAFVAAAARVEPMRRALDAMLGAEGGPQDALLRYAHAVRGGLYFAPPRSWFH
ncbi:MAG: Dyp-type peroxidase [Myxococcaceae bacterium]|nr:Dyp-type peroxidase [Myxococcaceae bacterium]MCI0673230.1 Dyp-type peroxidase [Myxococcaceae bacterium]